jgi:gas vesicle protein
MVNKNNTAGAVGAGIVGAVVGAAVGAAAVVLSDEKNRKAIGKKFNEYKKDGQKIISDMKGKAEEISSQGKKKVKEAKKAVKAKL